MMEERVNALKEDDGQSNRKSRQLQESLVILSLTLLQLEALVNNDPAQAFQSCEGEDGGQCVGARGSVCERERACVR